LPATGNDGVLHPIGGDVAPLEYVPLLVAALEPYPAVEIVLSTSWVPVFGLDGTRDMLPAELRQRVVNATYDPLFMPQAKWSSLTRYAQIARYVKRRSLTRWLAIDDDVEGWPAEHRKSLVRTSGLLGLSHPDAIPELAEKLIYLCAE
jgi:hypothetical protein